MSIVTPHPPQPRGKGGDMWCVFPLLTLSYAWLGGGFFSYGSPTLVCGAFMWECIQPAKGLFIWEAGRDVCRDRTMNGIPACINFYYIYHQMFIWTRDVFRPVSGKRDPGLCNRDPTSTGTFSSQHELHLWIYYMSKFLHVRIYHYDKFAANFEFIIIINLRHLTLTLTPTHIVNSKVELMLFLPCKHLLPGWNERWDDFGVLKYMIWLKRTVKHRLKKLKCC